MTELRVGQWVKCKESRSIQWQSGTKYVVFEKDKYYKISGIKENYIHPDQPNLLFAVPVLTVFIINSDEIEICCNVPELTEHSMFEFNNPLDYNPDEVV